MAPDPEPRDLVVLYETEGAVPKGHAYGVDRFSVVNLLELEAGVRGVIAEESVGFPSRVPDFKRQLAIGCPEARGRGRPHSFSGSRSVARPAVRSARASAASFPSASREPANCCAQRSSSRSSSSNQRPTRSCSSGGRAASFAIAASNVSVTISVYPFRIPIPPGGAQPGAVAAERRWPPQVTSGQPVRRPRLSDDLVDGSDLPDRYRRMPWPLRRCHAPYRGSPRPAQTAARSGRRAQDGSRRQDLAAALPGAAALLPAPARGVLAAPRLLRRRWPSATAPWSPLRVPARPLQPRAQAAKCDTVSRDRRAPAWRGRRCAASRSAQKLLSGNRDGPRVGQRAVGSRGAHPRRRRRARGAPEPALPPRDGGLRRLRGAGRPGCGREGPSR